MLTEKYRPQTLDEIVGQDEIIDQIRCDIGDKNNHKHPSKIPHFLLHGEKSGTGKTTTAYAIIKELNADHIELNASDERGIDTIRDKVIKSMKYNYANYKVILLQEGDSLTGEAMTSLRSPLEQYTIPTVIITCNYVEQILPAIRSRCMEYEFNAIQPDVVKQRLKYISECEGLKDNGIDEIAKESDGDMRKAILMLGNNGGNKYKSIINKYM